MILKIMRKYILKKKSGLPGFEPGCRSQAGVVLQISKIKTKKNS